MPQPHGEFSWIFFTPMAAVLGFATFFLVQNLRIVFTSTRTTGTVIAYDSAPSTNGSTVSRMNAEFVTPDGVRHEAHSVVRTSFTPKQEGDRVTIYYQPAHPDNAVIATFINFWLHVVVLECIGCILFLCWFGILVGVTPPNSEYYNGVTVEHYGPPDASSTDTTVDTIQN